MCGKQGSSLTGGNWSNDANAGLWYANVNNDPSNSSTGFGSRLADDNGQKLGGPRATSQCLFLGAALPSLSSAKD